MRLTSCLLFISIAFSTLCCIDDATITPSLPPEDWTLSEYVIQMPSCSFPVDPDEDKIQPKRPGLMEELLLIYDETTTELFLRFQNGKFEMIKHGEVMMAGTVITTQREIILISGDENIHFTIIEQSDKKLVLKNGTIELKFGSDITITFTRP